MTEFKEGDRVRVTFEGKVYDEYAAEGWVRITSPALADIEDVEVSHVEKLTDPEPVWVDGDLVRRHPTSVPIARIDGEWICANGFRFADPEVSSAWSAGSLEVLYKADA